MLEELGFKGDHARRFMSYLRKTKKEAIVSKLLPT
jgi:hypothetical protein